MKVIIELGMKGGIFDVARKQVASAQEPDYHLSFESARTLFTLLTPARIDLLDTLRRSGPSSVYALAKQAGRNYSNVHADVAQLIELSLIERTDEEIVFVPFDEIDIHLPLAA